MLVLVGLGAPILAHKLTFLRQKGGVQRAVTIVGTNCGYGDRTLNWIEEILIG